MALVINGESHGYDYEEAWGDELDIFHKIV